MPEHLVLVGMMGSGKSSVGRRVAEALDRPLLDTDALVEERTGRTVRQLFDEGGEAGFRRAETDAVAKAAGWPGRGHRGCGRCRARPGHRALADAGGGVAVGHGRDPARAGRVGATVLLGDDRQCCDA